MYLLVKNADYSKLINEWACMVNVTSLLIVAGSALGFSLQELTLTEKKMWCVKVMYIYAAVKWVTYPLATYDILIIITINQSHITMQAL